MVTIDTIPRQLPIVGIVSTAMHRHNENLGTASVGRAAALAVIVLFPGCGPQGGDPHAERDTPVGSSHQETAPGLPVTVTDALGRTLAFQAPPSRIVSLVPAATRSLEALGAQDLLVGRTAYDTTASLAGLPSVGGGLQPSLEVLASLRPDLVILYAGESDRATPLHLDQLGIRYFAVRLDRIADVRKLIRHLGLVTGRGHQADSLLAHMASRFQEIQRLVAGRPPVRVAYLLGSNPPWVAGPGTFIHELLAAAGGENPFADLKAPYGPVSPEEFLARRIDLVLAPEGAEVFLPSSSIRVVRVSPDMELPGPDLAHFARELALLLHPQVHR